MRDLQVCLDTYFHHLNSNVLYDPQKKAECEEKYCKELEEEDDYDDYRR